MRLSIIIALYNTELYIEKCVRSIYLNNPLSVYEYEVLVINDGSFDASEEIVKSLQREFVNLILINKANGGQSTARNLGFKHAKGNYIFCLDSDDSLNAPTLMEALEYAEQLDLDILPIYFRKYDEHNVLLPEKSDNYSLIEEPTTGANFLNSYVVSGSMWRYLYRTSILSENNLYLTEGIYHEDEEFIVKFLSYSIRVCYQRHLVYNHLVRGDSTVNRKDKKHRLKLLNDLVVVIRNLDVHRKSFNVKSLEYTGISRKVEQLIIAVFLRMKKDGLHDDEIDYFVNKFSELKLYPIKIDVLGMKFRIAALFFNKKFLRKLYYR